MKRELKNEFVKNVEICGEEIPLFTPWPKKKSHFLFINNELYLKTYDRKSDSFTSKLMVDSEGNETFDFTFVRKERAKKGIHCFFCDCPEEFIKDLVNRGY